MKMKNATLLLLTLFFGFDNYAQQLSFPTAEGYGKYTKGGRGGVVYEVTNLNDSGLGSLRAAVEASGPRTVVFRVSGTITLTKALDIRNPYITIAGQTAPGDGITIRKFPIVVRADEVIIRYLRVRLGSESGRDDDAMGGRYFKNIIIDHVLASWSVDEVMSFYHCENITVQWCILSEALVDAGHASGPHGFGGIAGSNYGTYHHNLFAHNSSRTPRMASGSGHFDFRNNVIYNWGYQNIYGAENQQVGDPVRNFSVINLVANYYKRGPATVSGDMRNQIARPSRRDVPTDYGKWYIADNVMVGNASVTADNWLGVNPDGGKGDIPLLKLNDPWPSMPINQQTAEEAYLSVLAHAGCSFPKRDAVDNRIIQETFEGVATYEGSYYKTKWAPRLADPTKMSGMIDNPADVGGWPTLNSTTPPVDTDKDGMPDEWEIANGLDPNNPSDRNNIGAGGYTMLEIYLNSLVDNVAEQKCQVFWYTRSHSQTILL
jgi:pectate lyase